MTTATPIRLLVRPITVADNLAIANVIRDVSAEFGLTADKGYTVSDPNLDHLFELYSQPRSAYWVIEVDGNIAGGGGVAPLSGGEADLCELQKMYFLPILRGKGLAKQLALQAFAFASAVAGLMPKYFWLTAESSMLGVLNSAISKNKVFIIFSIKTGCTRENHNSVLVAGISFCQIAETYFA